ncbi:MAG TPA: AAA family ATPase [Microlunatus sp.]
MATDRRPLLVLVVGRPGSGKTTLSKALTQALGASYLRLDAIETAIESWRGDRRSVGPEGYAVAFQLARSNLELGRDVIVDAVCPVPESRSAWRDLAADSTARLLVLELVVPDTEEHRRRVHQRRPDMPDQQVPSWSEVLEAEWVAWDAARDGDRTIIDATSSAEALRVARSLIQES